MDHGIVLPYPALTLNMPRSNIFRPDQTYMKRNKHTRLSYRLPAQRPLAAVDVPKDNLRPMFPKQTQLQKSTLRIQTPVSRVSCLASPPKASFPSAEGLCAEVALRNGVADGAGIMSGLTPMSTAEPASPTMAERSRPGLERSMSHQRSGLARASVRDT